MILRGESPDYIHATFIHVRCIHVLNYINVAESQIVPLFLTNVYSTVVSIVLTDRVSMFWFA